MSLEGILAVSLILWGVLVAYIIHMDMRLRNFEEKIKDLKQVLSEKNK